mmetsp:Transcript_17904/g.45971  ORF Transcript_17904/g.45971 Transcript_17904/m.45971 type:complete len:225 (+) Transcript_17904:10-684(+)
MGELPRVAITDPPHDEEGTGEKLEFSPSPAVSDGEVGEPAAPAMFARICSVGDAAEEIRVELTADLREDLVMVMDEEGVLVKDVTSSTAVLPQGSRFVGTSDWEPVELADVPEGTEILFLFEEVADANSAAKRFSITKGYDMLGRKSFVPRDTKKPHSNGDFPEPLAPAVQQDASPRSPEMQRTAPRTPRGARVVTFAPPQTPLEGMVAYAKGFLSCCATGRGM